MQAKELTEEQLAAKIRADIQRIETRYFELQRLLALLLYVHGPMELPVEMLRTGGKDLAFDKKQVGRNVVYSAVLTHPRRPF